MDINKILIRLFFITTFLASEMVTASTTNKFSPKAGVVTLALTYSFG